MSALRQSRNARFARRMRDARIIARIARSSKALPGYVGATLGLTITDKNGMQRNFGPGAIFFGTSRAPL